MESSNIWDQTWGGRGVSQVCGISWVRVLDRWWDLARGLCTLLMVSSRCLEERDLLGFLVWSQGRPQLPSLSSGSCHSFQDQPLVPEGG